LRQTNERIARAVEEILADLRFDPFPPTAEELRDQYTGIWKVKVDGWRIFYEVDERDRVVTVVAIKRRDRDTYRRMIG
jgi:mRNA-degrading endonuclease RelE of RelBE toxin-antitoxin system